jgi:hypothetical protein
MRRLYRVSTTSKQRESETVRLIEFVQKYVNKKCNYSAENQKKLRTRPEAFYTVGLRALSGPKVIPRQRVGEDVEL